MDYISVKNNGKSRILVTPSYENGIIVKMLPRIIFHFLVSTAFVYSSASLLKEYINSYAVYCLRL